MGFRIIAKSDGTDLYTHSSAVLDTARIINYKTDAQLDDNIIYWMCILRK